MSNEDTLVPIDPPETAGPRHAIDRRQWMKGAAAVALMGSGIPTPASSAAAADGIHELGLAAAARAIRTGAISAEFHATTLLDRAQRQAELKSFITIDRDAVLEAARAADKARAAGRTAALLGVSIGVKDSYLTQGLATTFGTAVLDGFAPVRDAAVVAAAKGAGAIVFGKNNLAEMSYGLTGVNAHHGQVRNPYDGTRITGGSSSGAAAAVAARIVPAALGGDTVGSIRLPASLCGVVGFKPTPGRWSSAGIAPISGTLDTAGVLARSVDDCLLMDTVLMKAPLPARGVPAGLKGLRLAHAPRQTLEGADPAVVQLFGETLRKLKDAGAEIVEIDLGTDFSALAARTTWPIFFYETRPAVSEFVARNGVPANFEQIYEGLGPHIKGRWSKFVVPAAPDRIRDEVYQAVMATHRPELQRRFATLAFGRADALLFPTARCAAPTIANQWKFQVAGKEVNDTFLASNTHPASGAGLPGISLPMGLSPEGLPLGIELDAQAGHDRALLQLAQRVEAVIGTIAAPPGV